VYAFVESGVLHCAETAAGLVHICVVSALARFTDLHAPETPPGEGSRADEEQGDAD
jgi:hypothetical protein